MKKLIFRKSSTHTFQIVSDTTKDFLKEGIISERKTSFFRAPKEEPGNQGWMGYFGKALMTPASYLPSQVTEVFSQGRAFAVAKLPRAGL